MEIYIPAALVLGCNTPIGIGVLSDWIEEQTGYPPCFADSGWSSIYEDSYYNRYSDSNVNGDGDGYGNNNGGGYGDGYGDGDGDGYGYIYGNGCGRGNGCSY